jgi:hypothetical protein
LGPFPAACHGFVIPANAGIQKRKTGCRIKSGMTKQVRYPVACCGVVHFTPLFSEERDFEKGRRGREGMKTGFISPKDKDFSGLKFDLKAL